VAYEDVRLETRGLASWIVIDRPKAMNAVRPRTYQELVDAHAAVEELIEKLSMGSPLAQRAIKRTVQKGLSMAWRELEEYGRLLSDELWKTEDHREGVRSHVEKRKPEWKER
jgi:enoyl-CoA hydratase/carnithine racemase